MKKIFLGAIGLLFTVNCFSIDLYVKDKMKSLYYEPEIEVACYNAVNNFIKNESTKNLNIIESKEEEYKYPRIEFAIYTMYNGKDKEIKFDLYKSKSEKISSEINYINKELINSPISKPENLKSKTVVLPYEYKYNEEVNTKDFDADSDIDEINHDQNNYGIEYIDLDDLQLLLNSTQPETKKNKTKKNKETTVELNEQQAYYEENLENLIYLYLKAFLPFLDDSEIKKEKINYMDNLYLGSYYQMNKIFSNGFICNINATKDGSIIVSNSLGLCAYNCYGELISILSEQIPKEFIRTNYSDTWMTHIAEDETILVVNLNSPYIFIFDNEMRYIGKKSYNFPAYNMISDIHFDGNDEPVLYKNNSNGIKLGQGFQENINYNIGLYRTFNSSFIKKNNETWFFSKNTIFVYDQKQFLKKIIICENNSSTINEGRIIFVHDNDEFIMSTNSNVFRKYNSDGKIISTFTVDGKYINNLTYNNGIYYISTYDSLKRFYEDGMEIDEVTKKSIALNNEFTNNNSKKSSDLKKYLNLAEEYAKEKAYWNAYNLISEYLKYCPGDTYASEIKLKYELELAKEIAMEYKNSAIELYDTYGEESAKSDYSNAMQLIEKFKKSFPDDKELNDMYFDLKYTFSDGDYTKKHNASSLSVESVYLYSIFPALQNYYSKNASGKIVVKNNSENIIKNLTITSNIKKYMDFASESEVIKELKPGETKEIDLYTYFNNNILSVIENTNSQILINLLWDENGSKEKLSISRSIIVYNKSAITWQDTGMLSCFILPEDNNIKTLAYEILNKNKDFILSKNLTNAISLINGIKELNLKYVPDPVSQIADLINNDYAIDSIKYPSETINLKGGDCDDLTVLFCSLLESSGIETALITTEGHIFGAFNTGLTYNSIFENLDKNLLVLNVDGFAWIPIETTVINNGFFEAWKKASEELENTDDFYNLKEIVLLSEVRDIYPPVSIVSKKINLSNSDNKITDLIKADFTKFDSLIKNALNSPYKTKDVYELNSMARIFYIYGNNDKAIDLLNQAINLDSNYKSAYINLINIYNKTGNSKEALKLKTKADKIKNDSSEKIKLRAADSSTDDEWDEKSKKGIPVRKSTAKVGSKRTSKGIRTISTRADDGNFENWQD